MYFILGIIVGLLMGILSILAGKTIVPRGTKRVLEFMKEEEKGFFAEDKIEDELNELSDGKDIKIA